MQPLFTIHAGEYLVGSHIEQHLRDPNGDKVNVWVPSKDTGIDLLVTDKTNKKTTSLQVKFSKDLLLTHGRPEYRDKLLACGWWTLNRENTQVPGGLLGVRAAVLSLGNQGQGRRAAVLGDQRLEEGANGCAGL